MNSLLILLLFCPLIFSASVSLGSLDEYNGATPDQQLDKCIFKAYEAARHYFSSSMRNPFTEEEMSIAMKALKQCIADIALVNTKVKRVEKELTQKMSDALQFAYTDLIKCVAEIENKLRKDQCHLTTTASSRDFCDEPWGKNGCMIEKIAKYCGEEMPIKLSKMALFMSSKHKQCVDKYFK